MLLHLVLTAINGVLFAANYAVGNYGIAAFNAFATGWCAFALVDTVLE